MKVARLILLPIAFPGSGCDTTPEAAPTKHDVSPQLAEIRMAFSGESIQVSDTPVDCTLSQVTKTQCVKITVSINNADHDMGPWSPRSITDTKEKAGISIDSGKVYDADGKFIENLSSFYQNNGKCMIRKAVRLKSLNRVKLASLPHGRMSIPGRNYA